MLFLKVLHIMLVVLFQMMTIKIRLILWEMDITIFQIKIAKIKIKSNLQTQMHSHSLKKMVYIFLEE